MLLVASNWSKIQDFRSSISAGCPTCGAQFLTNVKFCTSCGTPMKGRQEEDSKPKSTPSDSESKPKTEEAKESEPSKPAGKSGASLDELIRKAASKPRAADEVSITSNRTGDASFVCPLCDCSKTVLKFEVLFCSGCGLNITLFRLEGLQTAKDRLKMSLQKLEPKPEDVVFFSDHLLGCFERRDDKLFGFIACPTAEKIVKLFIHRDVFHGKVLPPAGTIVLVRADPSSSRGPSALAAYAAFRPAAFQ